MFMFCYFYDDDDNDDDDDDDNLPNVLTLKKNIVYQGLEVVECLGINGLLLFGRLMLTLRQLCYFYSGNKRTGNTQRTCKNSPQLVSLVVEINQLV